MGIPIQSRTSIDYRGAVNAANSSLLRAKRQLEGLGHLGAFGAEIGNQSAHYAASVLIKHRFCSKMFDPKSAKTDELHLACLLKYIEYDESLLLKGITFDPTVDVSLLKSKQLLHDWLRHFKVDYSDVQFSGGESFISNKGDCSIIAKLSSREHWTTTANCLRDTCWLIYSNLALKRLAKVHMGLITRKANRATFKKLSLLGLDNIGFEVFSHFLVTRLLVVVPGARASSVPKNALTNRFINVEATFPMLLQRCLAAGLRRVLKKIGNHLGPLGPVFTEIGTFAIDGDAQERHLKMIAHKCATIDFSNASDSVILSVVMEMFPETVTCYLTRFRSQTVIVNGMFYVPNKLSSMGNGFTFEVMTLLLYALAYAICGPVGISVYGDDVIVPQHYAARFLHCASLLGFEPNWKKTFVDSMFRESCGGFYHEEVGYIVSYDIHPCCTYQDVITTHNKMLHMLEQPWLCNSLRSVLQRVADELRALGRAWFCGPYPVKDKGEFLSEFFWVTNIKRLQARNPTCKILYKKVVDKVGRVIRDLQLSDFSIALVPKWINSEVPATEQVSNYAYLLLTGRLPKRTIRGKGRWVQQLCIVAPNGAHTSLQILRQQKHTPVEYRRWRGRLFKSSLLTRYTAVLRLRLLSRVSFAPSVYASA